MNQIPLYQGITIQYFTSKNPPICIHEEDDNILQITYCCYGQIYWEMKDGYKKYLDKGDYIINTLHTCAHSSMHFTNDQYKGIIIQIHKNMFDPSSIDLLQNTNITYESLYDKFCDHHSITFLVGNEQSENIFSYFFSQPKQYALAYQKIKVIELLLYLNKMDLLHNRHIDDYYNQQISTIKEIHDYLIDHMSKRITIDELSKKYLMNPTTLKELFKQVYGTSLAAHIKEHRMQQAAKLLKETDLSISIIAYEVGYTNQSKFSNAFQSYYQILPKEYRKKYTSA